MLLPKIKRRGSAAFSTCTLLRKNQNRKMEMLPVLQDYGYTHFMCILQKFKKADIQFNLLHDCPQLLHHIKASMASHSGKGHCKLVFKYIMQSLRCLRQGCPPLNIKIPYTSEIKQQSHYLRGWMKYQSHFLLASVIKENLLAWLFMHFFFFL